MPALVGVRHEAVVVLLYLVPVVVPYARQAAGMVVLEGGLHASRIGHRPDSLAGDVGVCGHMGIRKFCP